MGPAPPIITFELKTPFSSGGDRSATRRRKVTTNVAYKKGKEFSCSF
jgi:hypothetical protein